MSSTLHAFTTIGHRGACGYEPENTLRSFAKALELNIDAIELDVHVCASGELVVIHDASVDRVAPGAHGYVADKTLTELQTLDVGGGERIPTLQQVWDLIKFHQVRLNIELKGPGTAIPVAQFIEKQVQKNGFKYDRFLVSSFNHYELLSFAQACPKVEIGILLGGIPIGVGWYAHIVGAHYIIFDHECVNEYCVQEAHKRNLKVFVYTVNDQADIEKMKALGVDGIISNFPDRI